MFANRLYFRYAIRLALGCFIMVLLYESLHLKNGYWAAFSVLGCVFPTAGRALKRSKERIIGTFGGMVFGIVIAWILGVHWVYVVVLIPICIFFVIYLKAFSYTYYALFNTVVTVLLTCLLVPGDWQIACVRMEMTLLGTVVAVLVTYFVLPEKASSDLPKLLNQTHLELHKYYALIKNGFLNTDLDYLQGAQLSVFGKLQKSMLALQESLHESLSNRLPENYEIYRRKYENLLSVYNVLLMLEIEILRDIKSDRLKFIILPLQTVMTRISALFNGDGSDSEHVLHQLGDLLALVKALRVEGANDASIPMATFGEHIQLAAMLEHFEALVRGLRQANVILKLE